jgi:hypothetical protein
MIHEVTFWGLLGFSSFFGMVLLIGCVVVLSRSLRKLDRPLRDHRRLQLRMNGFKATVN